MWNIAHLPIESPLILAPLAGYSDLPFRLLCREFGAGLCFSEMISCHGLAYNQNKTLEMLATQSRERPVALQLFGADVAMMAKAASLLNEHTADLIDINMGCPVKKVTKKGAGAALMAKPALAGKIIKEVVRNSTRPVTVKFRSGVNAYSNTCVEFAKMAEQCGASAVTVHGRNWAQGFTGKAEWQNVAAVKKAVSIPVIGNGDISSVAEAMRKQEESGCDGVMIGRGALGNPWVFTADGRPGTIGEIAQGALRHLQLMEQYREVDRLLAVVKNHLGRYFRKVDGSSHIRRKIYTFSSFAELKQFVQDLAAGERAIDLAT